MYKLDSQLFTPSDMNRLPGLACPPCLDLIETYFPTLQVSLPLPYHLPALAFPTLQVSLPLPYHIPALALLTSLCTDVFTLPWR